MDGVYRRQRYIYDLTRKYYLFGRDSLIRELDLAPGQSLVEIGSGTARNLILIARRYPQTRLFGLDASHEMLKTARVAVKRAGLEDRIALAYGYAEALTPATFGEAKIFDHAVFSYSLSMIPQWKQALAASIAAAARIHAVDFADLGGLGQLGATIMRGWLALFHVAPRTEIVTALLQDKALLLKENSSFRLLEGRYAFLLHCDGAALRELLAYYVAPLSHGPSNSD